ncbi:MAG: arylsulfatase [Pirellulaceae bacterium]|nr:arylsulfatase [Pirellulaceae bacterium]
MKLFVSLSLGVALGFSSIAQAADAPPHPVERPNVIVIMADDMGFSDLGCYGGEIQTPHLDRLAAEGLRFSHFYNCGLCGPSRASLMTGLHPHQVGIANWTGLLNDRCVTVFQLLHRAGYATCAVGRLDMVTAETWHDPANIGRCVDRFFGTTGHRGPGNYFKNVRNTDFYCDGQPYSIPEGGYKTDLITDFAVQFIREAEDSKPFLLYVAHYAPHWPLHAKPDDIAKYRNLYRTLGWDAARQHRLQRLIETGVLPAGTPLAPRDARAKPWNEADHQDWEAERMAVYAAQIDSLDQSVGRVMQAVHEKGIEKRTLVFFLSDNGASDRAVGQLDKPDVTWRSDGTPTRVGNRPDIQPGPADTFVTAGPAWSCLANTPFRDHKQTNFEGGIASPLIAWWPGVIHDAGRVREALSHIADIPATVLDVAGVAYPEQFEQRRITPLAGRSLLPVLRGESREGHAVQCWSTSGSRAVREGHWKLVAGPNGPWELYDLSRDRIESHDLAPTNPERVARMRAIFEAWKAPPTRSESGAR